MKFGDPKHPWRYSSESARKAAKAARLVSPWGRTPMVSTARARATFEKNRKIEEARRIEREKEDA